MLQGKCISQDRAEMLGMKATSEKAHLLRSELVAGDKKIQLVLDFFFSLFLNSYVINHEKKKFLQKETHVETLP